jgi:RNA-directed DNA polymerase
MSATKPFAIDKWLVYEAYQAVKANAGSAGVDKESIGDFEKDLKGNLYKIWNRMSSGSYFPPPVKAVAIPKKNGGERILGVPTVADRVAQTVVKRVIEPGMEAKFLPDSYGYRPGRSALDAVGVTRERCWKYSWVLEFDIKGLFDNIDHALLEKALEKHVECEWAMLYIRRWLTAPLQQADGTRVERTRGTPQGGVVTPRTQKITSSSIGKFPFIVLKRHLICVAGGHMLKAHVARHRFRKGTTGEQRLRSACSWSQPQRGRASIDRIIRVVASPGLSIPAGGTGTRAAAAGCPTDHSRHDQNPRRGRGGVARVCSRKRPDDGRDCWVRGIGVSGQGTPTWLIGAGRVMTCIWTMSLTACSPPSLSKSTRSWYRIGHAARGGRPG